MCNFISHDDVDGIVSALFFKHYNPECNYIGFYRHYYDKYNPELNRSIFTLSQKLKKQDIGIDIDINHIKCYCHHICPIDNPLSENPNNIYLDDCYEQFTSKCPLNTAMLLASKFDMPITTKRQIAVLVFCDGFFNYFKKFTDNCKTWLHRYDMDYITKELEENEEEIMKIIFEEITPIFSDKKEYYALKLRAKDAKLQNKEAVKEFCKYIIKVFNLNVDAEMFNINYHIINKYMARSYLINGKKHYERVRSRINEVSDDIISAALVSRNQLNLTLVRDVPIT